MPPRVALSRATPATTEAATVAPSRVACCTEGPSGLDVRVSTKTPRPVVAARSSAGRSDS